MGNSLPTLKLTYFDIQGVAEKVRLALVVQGIAFEDERINFAQWGEMKPTTKFGQLPLLTIGKKDTIAQSSAMLRYCARLKSKTLYPEGTPDMLRVEEILGLCDDFLKAWNPAFYMGMKPQAFGQPADFQKTEEGKALIKTLRTQFLEDQLPKFATWFSNFLSTTTTTTTTTSTTTTTTDNKFLVGKHLTIADLTLLPILARFTSGGLDFVPATCLDAFPKLTAWMARVLALPSIAAWYAPKPTKAEEKAEGKKKAEEKATNFFRIGTAGQAWGPAETAAWQKDVEAVQRSYKEEVLAKIDRLRSRFDVSQYGALSYDADRYPLMAVKTKAWVQGRPMVLVTGGVHGYETSGVQGALLFLETKAEAYSEFFNIVVCPCASPWGYERIQRWNKNAEDPNRGFYQDSTVEEASCLMGLVAMLKKEHGDFLVHVDLHETTDSDASEFRPAKCARDGQPFSDEHIPDGFYLVGDAEKPQAAWHKAMIEAVRAMTHIAPGDSKGEILDLPLAQEGVVNVPVATLFLCSSLTNAAFATTTEVYPDSPKASSEICNNAQVACLVGALDHVKATL